MRAVLAGQHPDRVPFAPCLYIDHAAHCTGRRFEGALTNPRLGIQWLLEANRLYRSHIVRVLPTPPRYVLGSACAVPRFTPVENMHAFASAALGIAP